MHQFKRWIFGIFSLLCISLHAQYLESENTIVIVSSYNPDVRSISENVEEFTKQYEERGGELPIALENMNCRNLSECQEWKDRLWELIEKYYQNGHQPALMVLLGNEASSTFFSLPQKELKKTPIMVGMRSRNITKIPENEEYRKASYEPESYDLLEDFSDYNLVGGNLYYYDVDRNVELINHFYPECDSLVFLSDNTFGGLTMKAYFKEEIERHSKYNVEYLDGRELTFVDVNNIIANMSTKKTLIVGTWRIDSSDSYALRNTTFTLGMSNEKLPAISLSSVGLGHWVLGGYTPDYHDMGKELADEAYEFLATNKPQIIQQVKNSYTFDYQKITGLDLSLKDFQYDYMLLNKPTSFLDEHKYSILGIGLIFFLLIIGLLVSLYYMNIYRYMQTDLLSKSVELEKARDKAEEASNMKSAFIANMSHEIRTPLNAIVGFSQVLTDPDMPITQEERKEFSDLIMMNSNLLLNLVNDILDISKMDAGQMKFSIAPLDVVEFCTMAANSAKSDLKPEVEIRTDMPEPPLFIDTDKERLLQVMTNLLSNAKKCTEHGSITVSVMYSNEDGTPVEKTRKAEFVTVSVSDTGCGIPADKAEEVFGRFKKLDYFRQGTGIGLSITRTIIELLGGRIWVDTSYTDGARFKFTHPIHPKVK